MASRGRRKGLIWSAHHLFNALFEKLRYRYVGLLDWSLAHRGRVLGGLHGISVASLGLAALIGEDFFPAVDAGQMRLHARGPAGTRIEETELRFAAHRTRNPRGHSAGSARHADRQHRDSQQLAGYRPGRHPHHLLGRRRDPDFAEQREACAHARITKSCCGNACARSSRT